MKKLLLLTVLTLGLHLPAFAQSADETTLRDIEQRMQVAKLKNDVATLDRYLHKNYFATNQSGNQRNKQQMLELFKTFPIASLTTKVLGTRITGETAIVTGTMDERSGTGNDHLLFTHTYLRTPDGWQLLASHQSAYDAGAPYDGSRGRSTRLMFSELAGAAPVPIVITQPGSATAAPMVTTRSGLSVEEVRVGGSCVVVVSRGTEQLAVTACNTAR